VNYTPNFLILLEWIFHLFLPPTINNYGTNIINMTQTILVTGASGTVGSEVINQLSSTTADANIRAGAHSIENIKKL
jgi:FlaA1/EpsC-like NDP-sugar epimerase